MEDEADSSSEISSVHTSEDEKDIEELERKPKRKVIDENLEEEDDEQDEDDGEKEAGEADEAEHDDDDEEEERSDSAENDNDGGEELFEIDKIVAHKKHGGQMKYKIRWKGYDATQDSWEPARSLLEQGCDEIIEAYWEDVNDSRRAEKEEIEQQRLEEEEILKKRREESMQWGGILSSVSNEMDEVAKKEILNLYVADRVMSETEKALIKMNSVASPVSTVRLTRSQLRSLKDRDDGSPGSSLSPCSSVSARQSGSARKSGGTTTVKALTTTPKLPSKKMAGTGKRRTSGLKDSTLGTDFITAGDSSSDEHVGKSKKRKRVDSSSDSSSSEIVGPAKKKENRKKVSSIRRKSNGEQIKFVKRRESLANEQKMLEDMRRGSIKAKQESDERSKKTSTLEKKRTSTEARRQNDIQNVANGGLGTSATGSISAPTRKFIIPKKRPINLPSNIGRNAPSTDPLSLLDSIMDQQAATVSGSSLVSSAAACSSASKPQAKAPPGTSACTAPPPRRPSESKHRTHPVGGHLDDTESAEKDSQLERITSIREREKKRISRDGVILDKTPTTRRRLEEDLPNVVEPEEANHADEYYSNHERPLSMSQEQFVHAIKQRNVSSVARAFRNPANMFDLNYTDSHGDKLLHMVVGAECGKDHAADDLIRLLADNGADLFSKNGKGFTALQLAVKLNKTCNVRRLIGAGSPINVLDKHGRNVMDIAFDHNVSVDIVKELLYAGANVSQKVADKIKAKKPDTKSSLISEVESHFQLLRKLAHEKRRATLREIKILDHAVSPFFTTSLCDPEDDNTYRFDLPSEMVDSNQGYLVTCMVVDSAPIFDSLMTAKDGLKYYARLWGWSPIQEVMLNGDRCEPVTEAGSHHFLFATNVARRNIVRICLKDEYRRRPLFIATQVIKIDLPPEVTLLVRENKEDEE